MPFNASLELYRLPRGNRKSSDWENNQERSFTAQISLASLQGVEILKKKSHASSEHQPQVSHVLNKKH